MNLRQSHTQRGIGGIVLVGVLVWLVFFTPYLPFSLKRTSAELALLRSELQAVGGELQRAKQVSEDIPRLEAELVQLQDKWDVLRSLLPKATEMSNLLTEITSSGLMAGVEFTLFQPETPEPAEMYTRYPILVTVTGGYHQVGHFFDNMCNMTRLVGISDVSLKQMGQGLTASTVEATATISAYAYNEESRKTETSQKTSKPNSQTKAANRPVEK
jgi:type IV pilus assembly protein PilO